mgnify:FL=1|tara:strand:- start:187 stop:312 length:126 start_codon:yes stop_codon:yes gene_type:complete
MWRSPHADYLKAPMTAIEQTPMPATETTAFPLITVAARNDG